MHRKRTWKETIFAEFVVTSRHQPRRTDENHNVIHERRLSVRYLNVGPPERDASVMTFSDSNRVTLQIA
jgi:hypothetical protein